MKTRILTILAMVTIVVALAYVVAVPAAANSANAVPAAAPQPNASTATPAAEPHPEIREALAALHRAKDHMEHAAHDFGGHRVDALKATDEAIRQLDICLKFDRD